MQNVAASRCKSVRIEKCNLEVKPEEEVDLSFILETKPPGFAVQTSNEFAAKYVYKLEDGAVQSHSLCKYRNHAQT